MVAASQDLVVASTEETLDSAWNKLITHHFLSLPVVKDKKPHGFVDVLDILAYVMQGLTGCKALSELLGVNCQGIANYSQKDDLLRVIKTANMWTAISVMIDFGNLHRLPIIESDNNLFALLSQSDVIKWLQDFIEKDEIGDRSIEEMKIGSKEVVGISKNTTIRIAFALIVKHKVSGIAVTGEFGELWGNISATDLKYMKDNSTQFQEHLNLTVEEYMTKIPPNYVFGYNPIFIRPVDPFKVLIRKIVDSKIHHIYIVEDAFKILGIISLIDLLKYILQESQQQYKK